MIEIVYYILSTVLLQFIITKIATRTQKFSSRALIRNLSIAGSVHLWNVMGGSIWGTIICIFIPIVLELIIEVLSARGYHIDKYIATEYVYSDFFEEVIEKSKMMSNFSEGNYDGMVGFDTKDHGQKNIEQINQWARSTYDKCFNDSTPTFTDGNGMVCSTQKIKYESENAKFALISQICGLNKETTKSIKILEIGFGKIDFMKYLRDNFDVNVTGVSISGEQVKYAVANGFKAYHMNCWDMTPETMGQYDLVLQCGNIEYLRLAGYDETMAYTKYGNIIKSLLRPGGKYFITGLHSNPDFYHTKKISNILSNNFDSNDLINLYLLWKGNDGAYPFGRTAFSQHIESVGFKQTHCEERTNDYYIYSMLWMSSLANAYTDMCKRGYGFKNIFKALVKTIAAPYYIHTYLTYIPHKIMKKQPWTWQFIPQYKNGTWASPSILLYILFEL